MSVAYSHITGSSSVGFFVIAAVWQHL